MPRRRTKEIAMKIGTRDEWQTARAELAKLEAEHAELGQKVTEQRRQLPWVRVEKEYEFDIEDGRRTLSELWDGRRECQSFTAFPRENGTVYHTYTVQAPDRFVAPYHSFLLERTPLATAAEPRAWRKDEYPD